ncbi:MAG: helix-turn-helix domain-containing protein [Oscillospiraceae bacterium]|nr:helix-turn-helix domain-containing protein [Oscillospiraceae bacterium]
MYVKLLQDALSQIKIAVGKREIGIIDETRTIIAGSHHEKIGHSYEGFSVELNELENDNEFIYEGFTYKPFGGSSSSGYDFAVFVEGEDDVASNHALMVSISLGIIKSFHDEKYDRNNFIRNVLLDNVLPGDVVIKSRELHFNSEVSRVVFLVNITTATDISAFEIVQNLFPDKMKDFVFSLTEKDIVLVKELNPNTDAKDLEALANSISDTLSGEFFTRVSIGIGGEATSIKDLARSFKEAQTSIEVGKVFDTEKNIINYSNLGIARLIYHLPTTLCNTFMKEVFKNGTMESLDHETLFTIQRFFENSLNVSETSRKLFVHRNTLVYRLDKIKKITGLDLRDFEHAVIFKFAMMVKKFLVNSPMKF